MAVKWTDEQQRVIDTRNCNILVSAAAGSGKTAVLVARILEMITDEKRPVDIDRLLVVTFTNAAAAEMRERIRDGLEQRAEEAPDNVHLQRQLVLVHNAKITTIHSFCLHVLRNHFQTVGIDPSFRVADEGEILLLEQDTVKETVDAAYEAGGEEYAAFLEAFTTGKSDQAVEDAVLRIYHFALGQPWPKKWLRQCREMYEEGKEGGTSPAWLSFVAEDTGRLLADMEEQIREALRIAEEPDGPYPYSKALEADLELLEGLRAGGDFASYGEAFRNMKPFARLSSKKDESISEAKKQQVQAIRGGVKESLTALRQRYYYDSVPAMRQEFAESGVVIRALTALAEAFMDRLAEKKAEKNILDFGDLEHLALRVLVEEKDGTPVPTAAALEYAEEFEEIMTDEYQDSNLVQELILSSISGRGRGEPNRFMVGDVKQSIYRFRLARPELFMEKYKAYGEAGAPRKPEQEEDQTGAEREANRSASREDAPREWNLAEDPAGDPPESDRTAVQTGAPGGRSCRICLHRNFRSRPEVLESVNYIFRQIMTENLGGIVYDKDAALYPGASFQEGNDPGFLPTEILLLEAENAGKQQDAGKQRAEAELVGRRIREIVGRVPVWDKEKGDYRPARYGDIVILLRTVSGWADVFGETLGDMGIPCFTGSQKGYFSAVEVRTVLSYLQILDNPIQDIPLTAVLRSPMGKLTDEELAKIRIFSGQRYFYDCCRDYQASGEDPLLREKLERFFRTFERLRGKCGHTPVHLLLWELLDATGYGEYAAALPAGRQRSANLDMLVEKAIAYEATSYRGLYHFVRYIESLKKYQVDYGEANVGSEADDTVRIMSIHKSKGLEFPIVFVSGMGKQFNETDIRSRIVMDPEMGMACDFVDVKLRTRRATLLKRAIQRKTESESLGEELRVLYVAMTRAKEKLILTGAVSDAQTKLEKWNRAAGHRGETLSYSWLSSSSIYLDWIMPAALRHPAAESILAEAGLDFHGKAAEDPGSGEPGLSPKAPEDPGSGEPGLSLKEPEHSETGAPQPSDITLFKLRILDDGEAKRQNRLEESEETLRLDTLLNLDPSVCQDEETGAYLEKVFSQSYPYEADRDIYGKLSVSELKKLSRIPEEEDADELYRPETVIPLVPKFRGKENTVVGAARGTVYHSFMENLDFSKKDELEIQLEERISCGKMTREEGEALDLEDIRTFLRSDSGKRMERAALAGRLYREQPFVLGVAANEIRSAWSPRETVLVQGIIDAYFIENGRIVVLDYKTDRVERPEELTEKYRAQLDYYALALERLTGYEVADRIIYSFHLGRDIIL